MPSPLIKSRKSEAKVSSPVSRSMRQQLGGRIRPRSLQAAIERAQVMPAKSGLTFPNGSLRNGEKAHTILAPQMSPIHFDLIEALRHSGYLEVLPSVDHAAVEEDSARQQRFVLPSDHSGWVIISALRSRYDLSNTSVMITQTGASRATNYIGLCAVPSQMRASGDSCDPIAPRVWRNLALSSLRLIHRS